MSREERQQQARATTRRAILDAALELFVSDGYAQVSIRNIAAKVEYSPGAIYSYFPSKDEIFFALAEEGFRLLGATQLATAPSADPLDDVRARCLAPLRVQQGAAAVLRARVPRSPRASHRPRVRALRVHVRPAEPRCVRRCSAASIRASSPRRCTPTSACGCCGRRSSASPRFACRSDCAHEDADASFATRSTRRLPACGPARHLAHGRRTPYQSAVAIRRRARDADNSGVLYTNARNDLRDTALPRRGHRRLRHGRQRRVDHRSDGRCDAGRCQQLPPPSSEPITRFLDVTGTLAAQEEAEVAAEVQGRVVATPVERGTRVADGAALIRISPRRGGGAGRRGRRQRRADRRPARAGRRRGVRRRSRAGSGQRPRATSTLAQGDFERAQMLFDTQAAVAGRVRSAQRAGRSRAPPVRDRAQRRPCSSTRRCSARARA